MKSLSQTINNLARKALRKGIALSHVTVKHPSASVSQHNATQQLKSAIKAQCPDYPDIAWIDKVGQNSCIQKRHMMYPTPLHSHFPSATEVNHDAYQNAVQLLKTVSDEQFSSTTSREYGIKKQQVGVVVSSTGTFNGLAISQEDYGYNPEATTIPMLGLGCAGGVAAGSILLRHMTSSPKWRCSKNESVGVVITSEMYSRFGGSYQHALKEGLRCGMYKSKEGLESMRSWMVPLLLLGDAVSKSTYVNRYHPHFSDLVNNGHPVLIDSASKRFPQHADLVSVKPTSMGLLPIMKPSIPYVGVPLLCELVLGLLKKHNLKIQDVDRWIVHPGGTNVLKRLSEILGIVSPVNTDASKDPFQDAWATLSNIGNCGSVTVTDVLRRAMQKLDTTKVQVWVIATMGPGLNTEAELLISCPNKPFNLKK